MHEAVRRGLEIMRDPETVKAKGILRTDEGALCASGCIAQAMVDAGTHHWVHDGRYYFPLPVDQDVVGEDDALWLIEPFIELKEVGLPLYKIIGLNDSGRDGDQPLPVIADVIEAAYAAKETV